MKVIFLQDVPRVGRRHEVKTVTDGYARNYLVPRGLAEVASKSNERRIAETERRDVARKAEREKNLDESLEKVVSKKVTFTEKASDSGSLFAGIGQREIAMKLSEETGVELNTENILLEKPIKEVGEYPTSIGTPEKNVEITVVVEREAGED